MVGVAVKVTEAPEQIGFADAATKTLTGKYGFTVMVTVLEVAGFPVVQVAFEVKTQETVFPLVNALLVKVALFVPTFAPFTFH